ncbi:MAG: hypothetical protein K0R13_1711 [Propionibacteriaceae bacterium]|nr:hypothetical protein [Propionibacteriaceae bacterium]
MVSILVSKVAIFSAWCPDGRPASHSRKPNSDSPSVAPLLTASERVVVRLIEKACVGPPATIKSTLNQNHGAPG